MKGRVVAAAGAGAGVAWRRVPRVDDGEGAGKGASAGDGAGLRTANHFPGLSWTVSSCLPLQTFRNQANRL